MDGLPFSLSVLCSQPARYTHVCRVVVVVVVIVVVCMWPVSWGDLEQWVVWMIVVQYRQLLLLKIV